MLAGIQSRVVKQISHPSAYNLFCQLLVNTMYCPNCGKEVGDGDGYCRSCLSPLSSAERVRREEYGNSAVSDPSAVRRTGNSGSATAISVLLPGLGAAYAGDRRGFAVFVLSVIFLAAASQSIVMLPLSLSAMLVLWVYGLIITKEATSVSSEGEPV